MRLNTPCFQTSSPWVHKWVQLHLLFKQRGPRRENDNCVRLKLTKNTCNAWCHIAPVYDRALCVRVMYVCVVK